ncbi:hypothetical protein IEO21_09715 [Rhodonia placenta]|uniref:Uncharacterized protein n=1 Tax=Rhodonia placenta TaxID=104341 RepID=A0A8H7NTT2_9APHY|nr:hypothetical protein IEO21_09715 [Postia placenta]
MHSLCRLSPRERASDWLSVLDPGPLLSANIWSPQLLASLRRRGHVPRTMSRRRLEE